MTVVKLPICRRRVTSASLLAILIIFGSMLEPLNSRTMAQTGEDPKSTDQASIQINIDNPSFRKAVVAVPKIFVHRSVSTPEDLALAEEGRAELERLLEFSGLFRILSSNAFEDISKAMQKSYQTADAAPWLADLATLQASDWAAWKASSAESLTLASLERRPDVGLVLTMKTYDVLQKREILAKQFQSISDIQTIMRTYADFILQAYTGKPGIFNSKLAFVGRRSRTSPKQIFIADFDGGNIMQITRGTEPHLSPAWSPDGRYLAYTSFENRAPNIYVFDTVSKSVSRITNRPSLDSGANYSHNGKVIAFTGAREGDTDIFIVDATGAKRRLFIQGSGLDVDPRFSPDGTKLAFVSGRFGNPHIFVADIEWSGDTPRVLRDRRLTYAGWYNSTPAWAPDSSKIAFGGYDKDINRYDIFIMNPDGTKLERLTLKAGDNESPSWSPNGQLIAFQSNRVGDSNTKGAPKLWIMNRDGSSQRLLPVSLFEVQTPVWSPQRSD